MRKGVVGELRPSDVVEKEPNARGEIGLWLPNFGIGGGELGDV